MKLQIVPLHFKEACKFVNDNHRHHKPPQGHKFSIGLNAYYDACDILTRNIITVSELIGCAIVGRPVARRSDDGFTLEVTRLCTDGTKNACSMLYSAAWRVSKNMGYRKLITFILNTEKGISLIASGWKLIGETTGKSWNVPSRPRIDKHPIQPKLKFEISD